MFILECIHAETCLPDYWCGHHLPHVQIEVWRGMNLKQIKQALLSELFQRAVMGVEYDYDNDKWHKRAISGVNRMKSSTKGQRRFFLDLEETLDDDEGCDSVYAFFVFVECEV